MSRVLKFRAWGKNIKEYLGSSADGFNMEELSRLAGQFANWELEQYTGLKDKNGRMIYEGDIFRNTINGGTWRVYWDENDAAFWVDSGVSGCSLGEFDWDGSNRQYGFIRKNCEFIGNIHENPELSEVYK